MCDVGFSYAEAICSGYWNYVSKETAERSGYLRSALSSRNSIHFLRNGLPLKIIMLAKYPEDRRTWEGLPLDSLRIAYDCQGSPRSSHGNCSHALIEHEIRTCTSTGGCSPFRRLFSPKKPTSPSGLLRTRLTMTASFSRPWNPSTLPSSMPGNFSFNGASTASW